MDKGEEGCPGPTRGSLVQQNTKYEVQPNNNEIQHGYYKLVLYKCYCNV